MDDCGSLKSQVREDDCASKEQLEHIYDKADHQMHIKIMHTV